MKKAFAAFLLACLVWAAIPIQQAQAVACGTGAGTCFWIGSGTNYNVAASWSDTNGGVTCSATCTTGPATGDDVFFTSSGVGNVTLNVATNPKSIDFTGYTGTVTHNSGITITIGSAGKTGGVLTFVSGMTYNLGNAASSAIAFDADGGTNTFTPPTTAIGNLTIGVSNAGGTVALATRGLTQSASATFTLTRGSYVTNNLAWSVGLVASSNANTRTMTLGSSAVSVTGNNGAVWSMLTDTNLVITANTSTIDFAATAVGARSMFWPATARGQFNNVSVSNPLVNAQLIFFTGTSHNFAGTGTLTNVRNFQIAAALTETFTGNFTWTGPSLTTPGSFTTSNQAGATISVPNAVSVDYISVGQLTRTGAGTWTSNNCFDTGLIGSASITCNVPTGGGGGNNFIR